MHMYMYMYMYMYMCIYIYIYIYIYIWDLLGGLRHRGPGLGYLRGLNLLVADLLSRRGLENTVTSECDSYGQLS